MLANVPTMATWDDHDFLANNSNGTCLNRDYALDAFVEYWASPAAGLPATPGVDFNYRYATEVDHFHARLPDVST